MTLAKLSTKGQLVIPRQVRERHGWRAGTEFALEEQGDLLVLRPATALPATTVKDLLGCLPWSGPALTLDEMEKAIAAGALESR